MARPARRLQPARPARAVVYCRVSTDEQGDSGLGLQAQEATCRRWAAFKDVEVVAVTHDVCSGARPPADRDGFAAALALLEAGDADALVCAKLDRATRRQRGLLDLLDLAEAHGFALVLLDVDLDTSTPIGRAVLGILSVVAELEREQTRQRTKAALAAKRARGQRHGAGAAARRRHPPVDRRAGRGARPQPQGPGCRTQPAGSAHRHRSGPLVPVDHRRGAGVGRLRAGAARRPDPRRHGVVADATAWRLDPRRSGLLPGSVRPTGLPR